MQSKKVILPISIIATVFICAIGIFIYSKYNNVDTEVSYLSASWDYNYADINEISKASDLIALIRVNKQISEVEKNKLPFSIFEVEVIEPVYGCDVGDTISIYMTGGNINGKKLEIEDDPLLEKGQEFLVFTQKNNDGTYKILSGPQGRLEYKDKKLNSLQVVNDRVKQSNKSMNIKIENKDSELLINEIKKIVEK